MAALRCSRKFVRLKMFTLFLMSFICQVNVHAYQNDLAKNEEDLGKFKEERVHDLESKYEETYGDYDDVDDTDDRRSKSEQLFQDFYSTGASIKGSGSIDAFNAYVAKSGHPPTNAQDVDKLREALLDAKPLDMLMSILQQGTLFNNVKTSGSPDSRALTYSRLISQHFSSGSFLEVGSGISSVDIAARQADVTAVGVIITDFTLPYVVDQVKLKGVNNIYLGRVTPDGIPQLASNLYNDFQVLFGSIYLSNLTAMTGTLLPHEFEEVIAQYLSLGRVAFVSSIQVRSSQQASFFKRSWSDLNDLLTKSCHVGGLDCTFETISGQSRWESESGLVKVTVLQGFRSLPALFCNNVVEKSKCKVRFVNDSETLSILFSDNTSVLSPASPHSVPLHSILSIGPIEMTRRKIFLQLLQLVYSKKLSSRTIVCKNSRLTVSLPRSGMLDMDRISGTRRTHELVVEIVGQVYNEPEVYTEQPAVKIPPEFVEEVSKLTVGPPSYDSLGKKKKYSSKQFGEGVTKNEAASQVDGVADTWNRVNEHIPHKMKQNRWEEHWDRETSPSTAAPSHELMGQTWNREIEGDGQQVDAGNMDERLTKDEQDLKQAMGSLNELPVGLGKHVVSNKRKSNPIGPRHNFKKGFDKDQWNDESYKKDKIKMNQGDYVKHTTHGDKRGGSNLVFNSKPKQVNRLSTSDLDIGGKGETEHDGNRLFGNVNNGDNYNVFGARVTGGGGLTGRKKQYSKQVAQTFTNNDNNRALDQLGEEGNNIGEEGNNIGEEGNNIGKDGNNIGEEGNNIGKEGNNIGEDVKNIGDDGKADSNVPIKLSKNKRKKYRTAVGDDRPQGVRRDILPMKVDQLEGVRNLVQGVPQRVGDKSRNLNQDFLGNEQKYQTNHDIENQKTNQAVSNNQNVNREIADGQVKNNGGLHVKQVTFGEQQGNQAIVGDKQVQVDIDGGLHANQETLGNKQVNLAHGRNTGRRLLRYLNNRDLDSTGVPPTRTGKDYPHYDDEDGDSDDLDYDDESQEDNLADFVTLSAQKDAERNYDREWKLLKKDLSDVMVTSPHASLLTYGGEEQSLLGTKVAHTFPSSNVVSIMPEGNNQAQVTERRLVDTFMMHNKLIITNSMTAEVIKELRSFPELFSVQVLGKDAFVDLLTLQKGFPFYLGQWLTLAQTTYIEVPSPHQLTFASLVMNGGKTQAFIKGLIHEAIQAVNAQTESITLLSDENSAGGPLHFLKIKMASFARKVTINCQGTSASLSLQSDGKVVITTENGETRPLPRALEGVGMEFLTELGVQDKDRSNLFALYLSLGVHEDMCPTNIVWFNQSLIYHKVALDDQRLVADAYTSQLTQRKLLTNVIGSELIQAPFSLMDYHTGDGTVIQELASLHPNSTFIALHEDLDQAEKLHESFKLNKVNNTVINNQPVTVDFTRKLLESPDFLRYQLVDLDLFLNLVMKKESDLILGQIISTGATTFIQLPSAQAFSLGVATFFPEVNDVFQDKDGQENDIFISNHHPFKLFDGSEVMFVAENAKANVMINVSSEVVSPPASFGIQPPWNVLRVDVRNLTTLVHHHFDYEQDGHSRKYMMHCLSTNKTDVNIYLVRETDGFKIPYGRVQAVSLIALLRMGLLEEKKEQFYENFLKLPLYEDMAPWNIVFVHGELQYIDYDTKDVTFNKMSKAAFQIMASMMNYRRTVEDLGHCGHGASINYGFSLLGLCVESDNNGPCKDSRFPVPCGDYTCKPTYIDCLQSLQKLEDRKDKRRHQALQEFKESGFGYQVKDSRYRDGKWVFTAEGNKSDDKNKNKNRDKFLKF